MTAGRALAGSLALAAAVAAAAPPPPDAGERLYLRGITGAGTPIEGTVQGDVPLGGGQASCAACHGRSGFGSAEGGRIVPPVTGAALRAPKERGPRRRAAYDAAGIGRALREGIDASGRPLDPLMPRYRIADADLGPLIAHLDRLSARPASGVSARAIHLATIVTPDAPAAARDAALGVVRAYVASQNDAARLERASHPRGRYGEVEFAGEWFFHAWRLSGPPAGWPAQLAAKQRAQPVFAVVGGAGRDWGPVERFCEAERLPCLLPGADAPSGEGERWYGRYFSQGAAQEAEVILARIAAAGSAPRILQAFRGPDGAAAARALAAAAGARGIGAPVGLALSGAVDPGALAARAREARATAVVLWLGAADLAPLRGAGPALGAPVYVSGTLLGGELAAARALDADGAVVQPWAPEREADPRFRTAAAWLASRGLRPTDAASRRWHDQALFAARAFGQAFSHLGGNFSRELLLEKLDHTPGIAVLSSYFPRLDLGPGQRVLSKGCWVLPLRGPEAAAEWVVP